MVKCAIAPLSNPKARCSYYANKKYLGKKVKDIGKVGLDKAKEFLGILKNIIKDLKKKRISKKTAMGRLMLLYRLTFPSKNSKVRNMPKSVREKIRKKIREAMKKYL